MRYCALLTAPHLPRIIPYSVQFGLHFRTTRLVVKHRATRRVPIIVRADESALLHPHRRGAKR